MSVEKGNSIPLNSSVAVPRFDFQNIQTAPKKEKQGQIAKREDPGIGVEFSMLKSQRSSIQACSRNAKCPDLAEGWVRKRERQI